MLGVDATNNSCFCLFVCVCVGVVGGVVVSVVCVVLFCVVG